MKAYARHAPAAALATLLVLLPFTTTGYITAFALVLLMYMGMALSWNLISGFTGYVSFGHVGFFGLGAYCAALLITRLEVHWLLAALAGGLVSALLALPLGYILLRLRGPYFSVAMLGVAETLRLLASRWSGLTNGGSGIYLPPVLTLEGIYFAILGVTAAVFALTAYLVRSPFGLRLMAIRDDEDATEALGVDTTTQKVIAFVLSAVFPGILGGLYAWYISYIDPESVFRSTLSLNMLVLTFFGGAGTLWGPVVGAIVLGILAEFFWATMPSFYLIIFGLLVVANVLIMPEGIIAFVRGRLSVMKGQSGHPRQGTQKAVSK